MNAKVERYGREYKNLRCSALELGKDNQRSSKNIWE